MPIIPPLLSMKDSIPILKESYSIEYKRKIMKNHEYYTKHYNLGPVVTENEMNSFSGFLKWFLRIAIRNPMFSTAIFLILILSLSVFIIHRFNSSYIKVKINKKKNNEDYKIIDLTKI